MSKVVIRLFLLSSLLIIASLAQASVASIEKSQITLQPENSALQKRIVENLNIYRRSLRTTQINPDANRLASGELVRIEQILSADGYYQPTVTYQVNADEAIQYTISTGAPYRVDQVTVSGIELADTSWQTLVAGDPLVTERVLNNESALSSYLSQNFCYFSIDVVHQVKLDHGRRSAQINYAVNAIQPSTIGSISFAPGAGVSEGYLFRQTQLRPGSCFRRSDIDQAVLNLYQTQLFASVQRTLNRQDNGQVDIHFSFVKRPPRTFSASTGWDSTESFNLKLGWENRNLFGYAQWLSIENSLQLAPFKRDGIGLRKSETDISLTLPGFQTANNTLILASGFTFESADNDNIETDRFYILKASATLNRKASRRETYTYSVALQRTEEQQVLGENQSDVYYLMRFPASYVYDENPSNFNPVTGKRYLVGLEPVLNIQQDGYSFLKSQFGWSSYRPLSRQLTLANDALLSSIWAATSNAENIPASDRLQLGGGGSIRGFAYRSIDTATSDAPGLNALQGTLELRAKLTDSWGMAAFADSGIVEDKLDQLFASQWALGAGFGIRYYTTFAPIRLDVAMPMNQKEGRAPYQIYISLGQAF